MSASGGQTESKESSVAKTPEQTKWLTQALDIYGPTLGKGQQSFPGDRVAPLTETQTQATDVQGFLDKFSPYRDMPMFGETGQALGGLLSGTTGASPITPGQADEYFTKTVAQPAGAQWEKFTKPGIQEEFAGPGYWGGARANAVTQAGTELSNWLGTERANLNWDVLQANQGIEEAKAGRALSAIGPGMQYAQLPTQEAQQKLQGRQDIFNLASAPQQQQQAEINAAMQAFAEANAITDPSDLQTLMTLLGLNFSTASGSSSGWNAGIGLPSTA
ncbi:MAG: hypothetical protein MUO31_06930 [Thermodesulfovibrionales bacterium]|nr:hypothetical protein [Thermodesulfovibrionales bacterium]